MNNINNILVYIDAFITGLVNSLVLTVMYHKIKYFNIPLGYNMYLDSLFRFEWLIIFLLSYLFIRVIVLDIREYYVSRNINLLKSLKELEDLKTWNMEEDEDAK